MNVLFLTPTVNNWLANSSRPRILHVFEQVCNLINERGEVISIVTSQVGNGPFNLVIEGNALFSDHFHAESPISIHADQIRIGNLTLNTTSAKLWCSRPNWEMLHTNKDKILSQLRSLPNANYQPLLPHSLVSNFSSALMTANISSALTITSQLAGL